MIQQTSKHGQQHCLINSERFRQAVKTWRNKSTLARGQQLASLQNSASYLPWLRQMTRYKALNFLRDNKVNKKLDVNKLTYC